MDWQVKLATIQALSSSVSLHMRKPEDWYVHSSGLEIKLGATLRSPYGDGKTPEMAVNALWDQLTGLSEDQYIVLNAYQTNRRAIRWNGWMWQDVKESI
jgi:hypothetical protein